MSTSADRKRRYRERQRAGVRVYPVAFPDRRLEQSLDLGLLEDAESENPALVARALVRLVEERLDDIENFSGTRTHRAVWNRGPIRSR